MVSAKRLRRREWAEFENISAYLLRAELRTASLQIFHNVMEGPAKISN